MHRHGNTLLANYEHMINDYSQRRHEGKPLSCYDDYLRLKCEQLDTSPRRENHKYMSLFASTLFPEIAATAHLRPFVHSKINKLAPQPATHLASDICQGSVVKVDMSRYTGGSKPYTPHECSKACVNEYEASQIEIRHTNPLLAPLTHGWQRLRTRISELFKDSRKTIAYSTPCGRTLRNSDDLATYLQVTESRLDVAYFSFDWQVRVDCEFRANPVALYYATDIACGHERMCVTAVNCIDKSQPDKITYSTTRIPLTEPVLQKCNLKMSMYLHYHY